MKKCYKCREVKALELFYCLKRSRDGKSPLCKACDRIQCKERYRRNKQYYVDYSKRKGKEKRDFVSKLKDVPCIDCGNKYPSVCMDFDHIKGVKRLAVSSLLHSGRSMKEILEEVNKCEPVCSNCHRIRTWKRLLTHT